MALLTRALEADGEIVWFRRLKVGVKFALRSAGDGDKQILIAGEITYKP
jgi:hypothetical protein